MKNFVLILGSFLIVFSELCAQTVGDFRTRSTAWANWTAATVWQRYDGASWVDVSAYPTNADGAIEITAGTNVWITSNITLDQLTVYGRLEFNNSGGNNFFTLANGTGTDLSIGYGGSFYMLNSGRWTVNSGANWQIQNGGTYFHYSSYSCDNALNVCTIDQGSTVNFCSSGGILPYLSLSGRTYSNLSIESPFQYVSFINVNISPALTVNGKFTVGTNVSISISTNAGNNFNGDIDLYGSINYLNSFNLAVDKKITAFLNGYMTMAAGKSLTVNGQVVSNYANCPINGSVTFTSTGIFQINDNVGSFPEAIWNPGSVIKITGITTKTKIYLPASPYNIIWDCPNQTSVCEISNNTTTNIFGDFNVLNTGTGKITNSSTSNSRTINILGNLNLQGGSYHLYTGSSGISQTTNITGNLNISGGTLDLSSSANSSGNGNLSLKGNLNHTSGTITETGIAADKITLNGLSAQTLTTTGFDANSIVNIELNNSNGVSLLSDLSLKGSFTFLNGKFNLGNKNLTLASTITVTGYSASKYFVSDGIGILTRKGITAETIFPVGTSSNYSPVWITNADVSDDFSANVITDSTGINNGNDRVRLKFEVLGTRSSYNNNLTLKFGWMSASEGINFKNDRITYAKLWHIQGSIWTQAGSGNYTLLTGSEPYTLSSSNINNLSQFAIGQNENALPVNLFSFTHKVKYNSVTLFWNTASEENCSGFEIQRAQCNHNQSWQTISFIKSIGNSANIKNYSYIDKNLNTGLYQYRLIQTDYNGNHTIFNLASIVNISTPNVFALNQNYPNPFNSETIINYSISNPDYVIIKLFDVSGKFIKNIINQYHIPGYYSVHLNASNLSSGTYFYSLKTEYFSKTKKLIIIK